MLTLPGIPLQAIIIFNKQETRNEVLVPKVFFFVSTTKTLLLKRNFIKKKLFELFRIMVYKKIKRKIARTIFWNKRESHITTMRRVAFTKNMGIMEQKCLVGQKRSVFKSPRREQPNKICSYFGWISFFRRQY